MSFQLESWDTGEIVHINVHTAFRSKHGQVLSPDGHWQEIKASICEVPSDGSWKMSGQWHLLQNMRTSAEFITIIVGECFTKRDHHLELGWFGKYHKLPRGYCTSIAARGGGGSFKREKIYNSEEQVPIDFVRVTCFNIAFRFSLCLRSRSPQRHTT